jgi:hypothetical protein
MREGYQFIHWKWQQILLFEISFRIQEPGLLGLYPEWLGRCFLKFRMNVSPSYVEFWVCKLTRNPEDEGGTFIRNVGRNPATRRSNPEDLVAQHPSDGNPITASVLLKIYLFFITLSFAFITSRWFRSDFLWRMKW